MRLCLVPVSLARRSSSPLFFVVVVGHEVPASVFQLRDFRQRDGGGPPSAPVGIPRKKARLPRAHNGPRLAVLLRRENVFWPCDDAEEPGSVDPSRESSSAGNGIFWFPPTDEIPLSDQLCPRMSRRSREIGSLRCVFDPRTHRIAILSGFSSVRQIEKLHGALNTAVGNNNKILERSCA